MLEDRINQDLKAAMLAGDKALVSTLRGLKSTILYAKIAGQGRDQLIPDEDVVSLLHKEAKKRQESADLYRQGGNEQKAEAELSEKVIIERYLPTRLTEAEVAALVDEVIEAQASSEHLAMGEVISKVKQLAAGGADGALIARLVREKLSK